VYVCVEIGIETYGEFAEFGHVEAVAECAGGHCGLLVWVSVMCVGMDELGDTYEDLL